jgi:murein DD-endopeptidase MepM/ murein hydrolase activator NlpD
MHMIWIWSLMLLLTVYHTALSDYLLINPEFYQLDRDSWESEAFRKMELGEYWSAQTKIDYDCLTTLMIANHYDLTQLKKEDLENWEQQKLSISRQKSIDYQKLKQAYQTVLQDISCFPIPVSSEPSKETDGKFVSYENDFLAPRTYGGDRQHEGCDISGNGAPRGFYPVLSMTGGTIEQVGWLEKGGWRIGIRAPSGAYFYYAHLYGYAEDWKIGESVEPGRLLGYMGDSGYGTTEGTVGNFEVHLHLGIYLKTDHYQELSVNPYWVLRYSQQFIRRASY